MIPLVNTKQIREIERYTTNDIGISELILMEHAAIFLYQKLRKHFNGKLKKTRGIIFVGPGNNGADGLALARILHHKNISHFEIVEISENEERSEAFQTQKSILSRLGYAATTEIPTTEIDWIVDGIFGVGFNKKLDGIFLKAVEFINAQKKYTLSIDIPTGLSAETGNPQSTSVVATETACLGFYKKGLFTAMAADYTGNIFLNTIQIPQKNLSTVFDTYLFTQKDFFHLLPLRKPASHKGNFGHVYIYASHEDKQGACGLTSLAALRMGCGLVTVVGEAGALKKIKSRLPLEVMTENIEKVSYKENSVLILGPGLEESKESWQTLSQSMKVLLPIVIDASALNLIAENLDEAKEILKARVHPTILTPHPKEAARLLKTQTENIQINRFITIQTLKNHFASSVLLKGKGTLCLSNEDKTLVVNQGNTALSKAGSGDLLCGVIGALVAQGLNPINAMAMGSYIEGVAAEYLARNVGSERAFIASDIAEIFPKILRRPH
jgi:NAD(P)H-hydrate epimerase